MARTDREIRALAPRSRRYPVSDGGGLLLALDQAGGTYWMWRHRFRPTKDGRQQDLRLGPYRRLSLKAARQMRDEQKLLLQEQGIDPCKAKKLTRSQQWSQAAGPTFAAVANDWHSTKTAGTWSARHSDDVAKKLARDILPALGGRPIEAISTQNCLAVLRAIEQRGSNETAKRTLGLISLVIYARKERALEHLQKARAEQQQALRHLLERHRRGEEGLPLLELLQAVGVVPETVRRKRELGGEDMRLYTSGDGDLPERAPSGCSACFDQLKRPAAWGWCP